MEKANTNSVAIPPDCRHSADAAPVEIVGLSFGLLSVAVEPRRWPEALTQAERDVARHLIRGHSYRRIARARNVSEYTISVQVSAMLAKLRVGSAGELVALLANS